MKPRLHDPLALDVPTACHDAAVLEGFFEPRAMPRFAASLWAGDDVAAPASPVAWRAVASLRSRRGAEPQCVLELSAAAQAPLRCQRCLAPLVEPLRIERRYAFVDSEEAAAEADADNDEEDVLALTRRLDLRSLVEDELILALPLVPRHDECPQPLTPTAAESVPDEALPHPFAALAALRSGGVKSDR
jgi:uncharacterized protein